MVYWELPSVLLVVLVCWYVYQPIPDGVSHPWQLRAMSTSRKVLSDMAWMGDRLRIGTFHDNVNSIIHRNNGSDDARIVTMEMDSVPVRTYNLRDGGAPRAALVYFHGGGFMLNTLKHFDEMFLEVLEELDIVIVSVDYRVADGKIKFPAPLEDCLIVTRHLLLDAHLYNVDPSRISIGGDGAGGNLAAAAALKLRDQHFKPMPRAQILIHPMLQAIDFGLPSMVQYADGPIVQSFYLAVGWSMYATGFPEFAPSMIKNIHILKEVFDGVTKAHIRHEEIEDKYKYSPYTAPNPPHKDKKKMWKQLEYVFLNPYFAPLLSEDLYDLPEAYVYTGEADPLRDEGILYVEKLKKSLVPVTHVHGDTSFYDACIISGYEENEHCVSNLVAFLRRM